MAQPAPANGRRCPVGDRHQRMEAERFAAGQRFEGRGAGAVTDELRIEGGEGCGGGLDLLVGDAEQDDVGLGVRSAAERALDLVARLV